MPPSRVSPSLALLVPAVVVPAVVVPAVVAPEVPELVWAVLADLVVVVHFLFVVFVVTGGLLALKDRRWAWIHLPVAAWGFLVEAAGWICPLTPLEQHLRHLAGLPPYEGGFLAHYLLPVLYPAGLSREVQWVLAALVVVVNGVVYGWVLWRWRGEAGETPSDAPFG